MPTSPPDKATRDANLDALKQAVQEWADEEIRRLDNESKYMKAVLQGRGASNTGTANLSSASRLVVDEIDNFLVFE